MWSRSKKQEEEHFLLPSCTYSTLGEKKFKESQHPEASQIHPCTLALSSGPSLQSPVQGDYTSSTLGMDPGGLPHQACSPWLPQDTKLLDLHPLTGCCYFHPTFGHPVHTLGLLLSYLPTPNRGPPWDHIHRWKTTLSIPFFIHSSEHNDWLIMKNSDLKQKINISPYSVQIFVLLSIHKTPFTVHNFPFLHCTTLRRKGISLHTRTNMALCIAPVVSTFSQRSCLLTLRNV